MQNEEERQRTIDFVRYLVQEITSADKERTQIAVTRMKDMVLATNEHQRFHQDCIGQTPGALEGLFFALRTGCGAVQYHTSLTLAQLAWSHVANSELIPEVPGGLQIFADLLIESSNDRAREFATIAIGNCGANSSASAQKLVQHENLMHGISSIIQFASTPRLRETAALALKNCCSSGEPAAFCVAQNSTLLNTIFDVAINDENSRIRSMGIGAINCLSRSYRAVQILRRHGVIEDVLLPNMVEGDTLSEQQDLGMLTITCALVNLTVAQDDESLFVAWSRRKEGLRCIRNLVKCFGLALSDGRWQNVSFSPHSVLYPLHNVLRCCPDATETLLESELIENLELLISKYVQNWRELETLELGMKAIRSLCEDPVVQRRLREETMLQQLRSVAVLKDPRQAWRLEPEDQVLVHSILSLSDAIMYELQLPIVALCMGQHHRLGASSQLRTIDADCLMLIATMAFLSHRE
mmetsp:Transcript_49576/g.101208  ORF Transcript_49576/g.101208 Transcript_49576/m.101208 type:complete len:468 (-) Transcript_49576:70-1473(-)|eukprot:CAMPEP_0181297756 /NCGR_PEP_ID=MMETSP1101-20121128/5415_1 /TAXON_ID=46948 /ORGANISM="Rhodomonas abbreviata, Strain Caron Lab Isolate" /LENGTH=467 /DNA_ID=CAMNT_0023402725 /DNA_START=346 /DNA_END=1749 /DNA_ORIENTATION=+